MQVLDDDDDDPPLLNPLGYILFWIQFGLGLGLFVCLVIAIGLLIWCQQKNKHRPTLTADPEQAKSNQGPNPEEPNPEVALCTDRRPVISGPINNLTSALDEVSESNSEESIYNEPFHEEMNPFQGWTFPSSFRPVGPPPPPPPQAIPMVVRPVAKMNRSTMTECHKPKETLPKGATSARSDIKSGYIASPESSLERERSAGARTQRHLLSACADDCPNYNLPPLPVRTSSLRHKKKEGRKRHLQKTSDTMC